MHGVVVVVWVAVVANTHMQIYYRNNNNTLSALERLIIMAWHGHRCIASNTISENNMFITRNWYDIGVLITNTHSTRHTRHTRRTRPFVHSECIKYIKHEWHGIRTVLHYTTGVSLNGPKWFSNSEHAASGFVEGCSYRINIYRNWLKVLVHSNIVLGHISHSLHLRKWFLNSQSTRKL